MMLDNDNLTGLCRLYRPRTKMPIRKPAVRRFELYRMDAARQFSVCRKTTDSVRNSAQPQFVQRIGYDTRIETRKPQLKIVHDRN
jgi:hypothetical protein